MKKIKYFLQISILSLFSIVLFGQNTGYYYKDKFINIDVNDSKKYLLFKDVTNIDQMKLITGILDEDIIHFGMINLKDRFILNSENDSTENYSFAIVKKNQNGVSFLSNNNIVYESFFYSTKNGEELGISNFFHVKLNEKNDYALLQQLANEFNTLIIGQNKYMPLWYTLSVTINSKKNTLELANLFYESSLFDESEPDKVLSNIIQCTNDAYFEGQWGLKNVSNPDYDINICDAWELSSGDNIIIAVNDEGVQLNHPDMPNVPSSLSYNTASDASPSQVYFSHGTRCAGILGANKNNTIGIAGISFNSTIMSISTDLHTYNPLVSMLLANGINYAINNGADVISNSWNGNSLKTQ